MLEFDIENTSCDNIINSPFEDNIFRKSKSCPELTNNYELVLINNDNNNNNNNNTKDNNNNTQTVNLRFGYFYKDKHIILGKLLSITLHIFIMIVFEIFFYFNYVTLIEKSEFLNKLKSYLANLNMLNLSLDQKIIINQIINENFNENYGNLYNNYKKSLIVQRQMLKKLLLKTCLMCGYVGLVLIILFIAGIFNRKKINWCWLVLENILMFIFLGIFEYYFFTNIISQYNPITNDELKYYLINSIVKYFNSTNSVN